MMPLHVVLPIIAFCGMLLQCDDSLGQERLSRRDVEAVISATDHLPARYEVKLQQLLADPAEYLPELIDIVRTTPYPSTARAALRVLARPGKEQALVAPVVREHFMREWSRYSANPKVGPHDLIAAVDALRNVGTAEDVESLIAVLRTGDRTSVPVRQAALAAIATLADPPTAARLPVLIAGDPQLLEEVQRAIQRQPVEPLPAGR